MKNTQKGFIVPLIIALAVLLTAVGVSYFAFKSGLISDNGKSDILSPLVDDASTSSTSLSTSTNSQLMPLITSINPSSGPIGTVVSLQGKNLAGFEGELDAWIENANGEKAFLPGIGSVPRADKTIMVKIDSKLCKEDLSSKGGQCTSYMTITPGTYKIYTYPWAKMSNTVQFIVTGSAASTSQTINSKSSITVISPNGGEVYKIGDTINVRLSGSFIPADSILIVQAINGPTPFVIRNGLTTGFPDNITLTIPTQACGEDTCRSLLGGSYKIEATLYSSDILKLPCIKSLYCVYPNSTVIGKDDSDNYFTITNN